MKKIPPYGKLLKARLELKIPYNSPIFIFTGDQAFQYAAQQIRYNSYCLVLPPDQHFDLFEWPVANQNIVIIASATMDNDYIKMFALHLLHQKASTVCIEINDRAIEIYHQ